MFKVINCTIVICNNIVIENYNMNLAYEIEVVYEFIQAFLMI